MLNSVEARNPFLDYRIVNFAYSLDSKMKVNFFNLKIILKNIAKKYLDNKNINSEKLGLTPPINYWIRYYFKETIDEMALPEMARTAGTGNKISISDKGKKALETMKTTNKIPDNFTNKRILILKTLYYSFFK